MTLTAGIAANPLTQRLQHLWQGLRAAPPPGSLPLSIAGVRCGWLAPRAHTALAAFATRQGDAVALAQELTPGPTLDRYLHQVACTLRDSGCLAGWRNEPLAVLGDADGAAVRLGAIERAAARPLGLWTQAVHLTARTPDGRVWIARRALGKTVDPGLWDTLAGGLVSDGETPESALLRESAEEAGLTASMLTGRAPLRNLGRISRHVPEGYLVQTVWACHCVLDADVRPVNRDGEVMAFATVSVAELCDQIDAGAFTREAALVLLSDLLANPMQNIEGKT